ncbi:MAG: hypothetical protein K6T90_18745 [Leptolyngbyaceae cyanobacterium HOT.MB2.61]|nr:hypothetical protein [Leptolyngbyaceae cyanobacterium HOT.MB2.61]
MTELTAIPIARRSLPDLVISIGMTEPNAVLLKPLASSHLRLIYAVV